MGASRETELYKEQIELLKSENEFLKKENHLIIQSNANLKAKVNFLEEIDRYRRTNHSLLESNYEWLSGNLALSEKMNQKLGSLLGSSVRSDEKVLQVEYAEYHDEVSLSYVPNDPQFVLLKEKMTALQEALNHQEIKMTEILNQEKKELEDKIEKRILNLLDDHKTQQANTFQIITESFKNDLHVLKRTDDVIDHLIEADADKLEMIKQLQDNIYSEIRKDQDATASILRYMTLLEKKQNFLEDQQSPMFEIYQIKKTKLTEQNTILKNEKQRLFYNTFYKIFSAKLIAAIVLSSELVKHDDRLTDKVGKFTANMIGAAIGCVPVIGNIMGSLTSFFIEETIGIVKGLDQSDKASIATDSVITLDKAMKMAELIARRLTQRYINTDCTILNETIEEMAACCARTLYNFIKFGNLLEYKNENVESKVAVLIKETNDKHASDEGFRLSPSETSPNENHFINDVNKTQKKTKIHRRHSERYNDLSLRAKHQSNTEAVEVTRAYSLTHIERLKKDISETKQAKLKLHEKINDQDKVIVELVRNMEILQGQLSSLIQSKSESVSKPFQQTSPSSVNAISNLFTKKGTSKHASKATMTPVTSSNPRPSGQK